MKFDDINYSKKMLQAIDDGVSDAILVLSRDFEVVWANRAAEEQSGFSRGEMLGKHCYWVIHRRERPCPEYNDLCPCQTILKTNESITAIHEQYNASGEKQYYEVTAYPLKDDNGEVFQFVHFTRDVTARKHAEEALAKSEERYSLAQKVAHIGSWDWDIKDGALIWSETIEPMFGFDRGKFKGTYEAFLQSVHPDDRQSVVDSVNACIERGEDYGIDHRIVWPDGTVRWMSETGNVIRNDRGKAVRMLGIVRDVTERKNMENELRERVKELDCLYGISKVLDRRGITLDEVLQETADLIASHWQYPRITCARIIMNGNTFTTKNYRETEWRMQNDIRFDGRLIGSIEVGYLEKRPERDEGPFLNEERSLIEAIAERLGKVTERYRIEEEMKKVHEEILRLDKMRSDFTSMVSHELRTPLSSIKEGIDIVLEGIDGPVGEAQRDTLGIAKRNVDRLARMINKVLDFSRLESGKMEMVLEMTDMRELVFDVSQFMKRKAADRGVDLSADVPDTDVVVTCDPDKMRQVLINLIDNAIKFTESGGHIRLCLSHPEHSVQIAVEDDGIGIKPEEQAKIFDMFIQIPHQGMWKVGGTGLGLTISQQIIRLHNGTITLTSSPGEGSTFTVTFPDDLPVPD